MAYLSKTDHRTLSAVIRPSIYPMMLIQRTIHDAEILCPRCTRQQIKGIVKETKGGYVTGLRALCLAEVEGSVQCDYCYETFSNYED